MNNAFAYPAEKFSTARRALMLPHTSGDAAAIANAFHECDNGLGNLNRAALSPDASRWVAELEAYMDITRTVVHDQGKGAWQTKAEGFTIDEKIQISRLVDELASWFDDEWRK